MSDQLKNRLMIGTIAIAMLAATGWCYMRWCDSSAAASAARQELGACRALAAQIDSLRQRPAVAGTEELGRTDISRRIEQAATAAGFASVNIERIEPQPVHRIEESNYLEAPTQVRLREITIRQLFGFLHAIGAEAENTAISATPALAVRNLRLSAPRGEENGDRWTVESTLTYTVYSPKVARDLAAPSSGAVAERP